MTWNLILCCCTFNDLIPLNYCHCLTVISFSHVLNLTLKFLLLNSCRMLTVVDLDIHEYFSLPNRLYLIMVVFKFYWNTIVVRIVASLLDVVILLIS